MTLWIIYLTSTHPKLSKNVYVYCIIPSSLFTTVLFKRAKTVCGQEPRASFCGILNELINTVFQEAFVVTLLLARVLVYCHIVFWFVFVVLWSLLCTL